MGDSSILGPVLGLTTEALMVIIALSGIFIVFIFALLVKCYQKVSQGEALIRNGMGGTRVSFSGMVCVPVLHRVEYMDISVKRIEINRRGAEGLICKDNLRADIQVAFFVRVNNTINDVWKVAQSLGCKRASDIQALNELFDAKFSEALKTIGKRFDFEELYTERYQFKEQIIEIIGTDLNGYVLEDAAIDYLEQTRIELMNPNNILDAEGIKKITDITARERVKANFIERDKEKTIRKQDVEAAEAILELNKELAEAEQKQQREIATITAREQAEAKTVQESERNRGEQARIRTDEELGVAEENKQRQIIVALKNKQRTDQVETERVERDRALEQTERERQVTLAQIEKDKAVEVEKKEIQLVIRERVAVERNVVEEEEKIKDTHEFATAERSKKVAVTKATEQAEQELVKQVKAAEAGKQAAALKAEEIVTIADANLKGAERDAEGKKLLADAETAEKAVPGMAEVTVKENMAGAIEKEGTAQAKVMGLKYSAEAQGITEKADAMKKFNDAGKEHEEFKLKLNKDLEVQLADIRAGVDVAAEQARVLGEAVKSARIDIVGGDHSFFDQLIGAITRGKAIDRMVDNSEVLTDAKSTFLPGDSETARQQIKKFVSQFGLSSEDVKNLTVAGVLGKMMADSDGDTKDALQRLMKTVKEMGLGDKPASSLGKKG